MKQQLERIINALEYSAFNLCENPKQNINGMIESTCSKKTLLIAIRDLKQLAGEVEG